MDAGEWQNKANKIRSKLDPSAGREWEKGMKKSPVNGP